jgi:hypothetical protein
MCRNAERASSGSREPHPTQTKNALFASFRFDHFFAAVKTGWADVVPAMRFTRGRLNREKRRLQEIMRTMHSAFRRGLFILLDGHDGLLSVLN